MSQESIFGNVCGRQISCDIFHEILSIMAAVKDHTLESNSHHPTPSRSSSDDGEDLEMQEIELEERLNLFSKKALHSARSSRPENTKKAYQPRQREWRVKFFYF
jgi:hypothetical protein